MRQIYYFLCNHQVFHVYCWKVTDRVDQIGSDYVNIERISENQIRCTFNPSDLQEHHINLAELAYGTEKARAHFMEMIQQAMVEAGFEGENIPLIIEASPSSIDGLTILITVLEHPEQWAPLLSLLAPLLEWMPEEGSCPTPTAISPGAEEILLESEDISLSPNEENKESEPKDTPVSPPKNLSRSYHFQQLDDVLDAASTLHRLYWGQSALYQNPNDHSYYLTVWQFPHSPESFNRVCNILSEYGQRISSAEYAPAYYREHYTTVVPAFATMALAGALPKEPANETDQIG